MNFQRLCFSILFSLCGIHATYAVNFQSPPLYEIALSTPGTITDRTLGARLSVSGSTAAVSALAGNSRASGAVYLYDAEEDWRLTAELNSLSQTDNFAWNIILQTDVLLVSADRDDEDAGAVYVFGRLSPASSYPWQQTAKITAPDKLTGARFGGAIALVDNVLYIGAAEHGQGKVYIFQRDVESGQWEFQKSIVPDDPQALKFGSSIAQDGEILIVGAPFTDANDNAEPVARSGRPSHPMRAGRFAISKGDTVDPGIESGAIFVYQRVQGEWQQAARLGASNRETGDHLGTQVAIEGNTIAASLKQKDVFDFLRGGAIYLYKKQGDEWLEDTALFPEEHNVGANFGNSFTLLDKHVLVGANKIHFNGFNSGQAYLYAQNSSGIWELKYLQHNADIKAHDQFGLGVALSQEYMLLASKHALYVFQDTPVTYYPAAFYPASHTLQLNEVSVKGLGVLSADFHLTQEEGALILNLRRAYPRDDLESSEINYLNSMEPFIIPRLAVPQSNGDSAFFSVTLQQIANPSAAQFRVVSIIPLD